MHPNLFNFATSELSQDAILCWLASWSDIRYKDTNPALHQLGANFLTSLYKIGGAQPPNQVTSIDIKKQEACIDVLCIINCDTAILIEDKVGTQQHSDQLIRYKDHVTKMGFAPDKIIPIYIQTGDQSDFTDVKKHGYAVFQRSDLLNILETSDGKASARESDILKDFTLHIRKIENDVQSYATKPLSEWTWNAWKGFYTRLQQDLTDGKWDYVPNPSGGFLGFWWHFQGCEECEQYLQIEASVRENHLSQSIEPKFCYKIRVSDNLKRREFRNMWHSRISSACSKIGLKVRKPDRFGNGVYMTVVILDEEYRRVNNEGQIDLSATVNLIRKAEQALRLCASSL